MIHDSADFTEERIRERAERHGFTDPVPVELFAWDCEVAAQLQEESELVVLKGGAATQLHLPLQFQRGSVDVDVTAPITNDQVKELVGRVSSRLPQVRFRLYTPEKPAIRLPMVTYDVIIPTALPRMRGQESRIKTDFLLEELDLPVKTMTKVETFALTVKHLRCHSAVTLLADKLLTLAENTIGIRFPEDYPKQIYDIAMLSETHPLSRGDFEEIGQVVEKLVPLEASYRKIELDSESALEDVRKTMFKYSSVDTTKADPQIKTNINNFQQFFVNTSQRRPWHEWSSRTLSTRFLAKLVQGVSSHELNPEEAAQIYAKALNLSAWLKRAKTDRIRETRTLLMNEIQEKIPHFKELRGKPLQRVFWQAATPENLERIEDQIL